MIQRLTKKVLNDNIEELIKIDNQLTVNMKNMYSTEMWNKENFICDREGKWQYSLISKNGANVQGCIIVSEYKEGCLHINRFFVAPYYEHLGIGKEMLKNLKENTEGIDEINLFVSCLNSKAIQFYLKNGFIYIQGAELQRLMHEMGRKKYQERTFQDEYGYSYYAMRMVR